MRHVRVGLVTVISVLAIAFAYLTSGGLPVLVEGSGPDGQGTMLQAKLGWLAPLVAYHMINRPEFRCSRPRGNAEFWTRVDRKMLWWPGHRQTDRFRVCSPASRRVAALRPRFRGAHGLDAGSAHAVQTCPCLTMPHSRPPRCCGRPSVQIDAVSDDR